MKYIKKFNENLEERALLIYSKKIHNICKEFEIFNYSIDLENGDVNINSSLNLSYKKLTKLPLNLGTIKGNFRVNNNQFTSLAGFPKRIEGQLFCDNNNLKSLEGYPEYVRSFSFKGNPIYKYWEMINDKTKFELFLYMNIHADDPEHINIQKVDYINKS